MNISVLVFSSVKCVRNACGCEMPRNTCHVHYSRAEREAAMGGGGGGSRRREVGGGDTAGRSGSTGSNEEKSGEIDYARLH